MPNLPGIHTGPVGDPRDRAYGAFSVCLPVCNGAIPNLKSKLAGVEGTFDQLLVKARFEETKLRDLSTVATTTTKLQQRTTPGNPTIH